MQLAGSRARFKCDPYQRYSDDDVAAATKDRFDATLKSLFALEGEDVVKLSQEAKRLWTAFHDRTADETLRLSGDLAAAWSKFRDTGLRIALILHLAELGEGPVSPHTMARALVLTEWFKQETRRVYAILADTPSREADRAEEDALLAWMAGRNWMTQRDIERGIRCLRGTGRATAVIRRLVKDGRLEERYRQPGPEGGPPTFAYRAASDSAPAVNHEAMQPARVKEQSPPKEATPPSDEEPWTKL